MGEKHYLLALDVSHNPYFDEGLSEMTSLVQALGKKVDDIWVQKRRLPSTHFGIGRGKVEEIKTFLDLYIKDHIIFIYIYGDFKYSHISNLKKSISVDFIDRTELILSVFLQKAHTPLSVKRIELAMYKHQLTTLSGLWTHFGKIKGGISSGKGMGEKQIEVDRRLIKKRIAFCEKELKKAVQHAESFYKAKENLFRIVCIGYTNAGKSSFLNYVCDEKLAVGDQCFLTLDATCRRWRLFKESLMQVVLTDTVGFVRDMPPEICDAFQSTLAEIRYAHLIFHIVDMTQESFIHRKKTVEDMVKSMTNWETTNKVLIINKVDAFVGNRDYCDYSYQKTFYISTKTGEGIQELTHFIKQYIEGKFFITETLIIDHKRSDLLSWLDNKVEIISVEQRGSSFVVLVRLLKVLRAKIKKYIYNI